MYRGDSIGGISANLFAPVQAPRLQSISRKAIQYFLAERASYEAAVAAQPGLLPVPWSTCFDAFFLRSLVLSRVFGNNVTAISQLTDELIKSKLEEFCGAIKYVSYDEAMADVKRNVRLDVSEPDARIRVIMLQASYIELCERRGWNFFEKAQKAAVEHITAVLQPPQLKNLVEDALRLDKGDLNDDFYGFCNFVAEQAEVCERFHPLHKYRASLKNNCDSKAGSLKKYEDSCAVKSEGYCSSPDPIQKPKKLPPCLNPDCGGNHYIKDCLQTSSEMKKSLLEAHRAKSKKSFEPKENKLAHLDDSVEKPSVQASAKSAAASPASAVVLAEVCGYTFSCRLDSGADHTVISDQIVQFLAEKDVYLPTRWLSEKKLFSAVDGHPVVSSSQVQICPTITTEAGPCRLRNIKAFVMPCADKYTVAGASCPGEIVLGNPFLIHSGLKVTDFIAQNIERLSALDYGELHDDNAPTKIGKLGLKLPSQGSVLPDKSPDTSETIDKNRNVCPTFVNGDLPAKEGGIIDYKDIGTGNANGEEPDIAVPGAVKRGANHIPGQCSRWADILTRTAPSNAGSPALRAAPLRVPLITEDLPELPSLEAITASQAKFPLSPYQGLYVSKTNSESEIWKKDSDQKYIPDDGEELELRVCTPTHCGSESHRLQHCLVCPLSARRLKVPRPLGHEAHTKRDSKKLAAVTSNVFHRHLSQSWEAVMHSVPERPPYMPP